MFILTAALVWAGAGTGVRSYADNDFGHVSPLHCMGRAVGGHSPLPFCTPVLYSRLTPPAGMWVRNVATNKIE